LISTTGYFASPGEHLSTVFATRTFIVLLRHRAMLQGNTDWSDWFISLAKCLGVAMILHGLYDTMLKREMNLPALSVAIASFVWLAWLIERSRAEEVDAPSQAWVHA
jgi:hypothetical protein